MNVRYYFRLVKAYISRFKAIILISILLGITIFFLANIILPKILFKTQKIGLVGRYHPNELPVYILSKIGAGLTRIDASGIPIPDLANSWETNDKGKTWTFHIKDNLTWHDGTPLLSTDINYEFSDVEIVTPDSKTIEFKLKDTYIPFPQILSRPVFKQGLIGTGEWSIKNIVLSQSYVKELTIEHNKERIVYKYYPTDESVKTAFKLGHINQIYGLLDSTPFNTWGNINKSAIVNENQVVTLFFNTQSNLLSDKSARQALTYALEKELLGKRAISPISQNSWAYNPQVKKYSYDFDRAKELIDEMSNEILENNQIKIVTTPALLSVAENIQQHWQKLGVNSIVQVSSIIPQEYDSYLTIFDVPKDPDQYPIWHSTQISTNISKYSNPRIDKLLEDGRITIDHEERKKIYLDFQRFLLEDLPAAFLYHPTYYTITRN